MILVIGVRAVYVQKVPTRLMYLAVSNGQHKSNNVSAVVIGVVVILVIVGLAALFKRRQ
jgi:hypothetical protein